MGLEGMKANGRQLVVQLLLSPSNSCIEIHQAAFDTSQNLEKAVAVSGSPSGLLSVLKLLRILPFLGDEN